MLTVGVDLGGTNLRVAVVETATGRPVAIADTPTCGETGPPGVIERMAALITRTAAGHEACAVGIGVPGLYDPVANITRFLPNLPTEWRGVPLGPEIERRTGLPSCLINDARAFALAEAVFGAGRGADRVIGVTLGTGIGGGVVLDGRLLMGHDGTAGEVGHQIVEARGPLCGCGSRGCLEAYAGGPAIAALGMKAVRQGRTTLLRDMTGGDLNHITPELIAQAAEAGDLAACQVMEEAGFWLGVGVANLITLFSPDVVVIGGGISQAGDRLLGPVRAVVQERCRVTPLERVRIERTALGTAAGAIGAAVRAAQALAEPDRPTL